MSSSVAGSHRSADRYKQQEHDAANNDNEYQDDVSNYNIPRDVSDGGARHRGSQVSHASRGSQQSGGGSVGHGSVASRSRGVGDGQRVPAIQLPEHDSGSYQGSTPQHSGRLSQGSGRSSTRSGARGPVVRTPTVYKPPVQLIAPRDFDQEEETRAVIKKSWFPVKGDKKPFREWFFKQKMVPKDIGEEKLREGIVKRMMDHTVLNRVEEQPAGLPPTPRPPDYLPPVPPQDTWTPEEALIVWQHLQCTDDDSDWWTVVDYDKLTREQLLVACHFRGLGVDTDKKNELVNSLKDWAYYMQHVEEITLVESDKKWREEIEDAGGIYTFGCGNRGALGLGDLMSRSTPQPVYKLFGQQLEQIAVNFESDWVMVRASTGFVFAWGGGGGKPLATYPRGYEAPVSHPLPFLSEAAAAHADAKLAAMLGAKKTVSLDIQLTLGQVTPEQLDNIARSADLWFTAPVRMAGGMQGKHIATIALGAEHAALTTDQRELYTWGAAQFGALGTGDALQSREIPGQVIPVDSVLDPIEVPTVFAGSQYCMALVHHKGQLQTLAWGAASRGRLGMGFNSTCRVGVRGLGLGSFPSPSVVPALTGLQVESIACGFLHTLAITAGGVAWAWGDGASGRLGIGTTHQVHEPIIIPAFKGRRVLQVSCGKWNSAAIVESSAVQASARPTTSRVGGQLYVWGAGSTGQLGLGSLRMVLEPVCLEIIPHPVVHVSCGYLHTACVTDDGFLYTWGCSSDGRLGRPSAKHDATEDPVPAMVPILNSGNQHRLEALQVHCGMDFTVVYTMPYRGPPPEPEVDPEPSARSSTSRTRSVRSGTKSIVEDKSSLSAFLTARTQLGLTADADEVARSFSLYQLKRSPVKQPQRAASLSGLEAMAAAKPVKVRQSRAAPATAATELAPAQDDTESHAPSTRPSSAHATETIDADITIVQRYIDDVRHGGYARPPKQKGGAPAMGDDERRAFAARLLDLEGPEERAARHRKRRQARLRRLQNIQHAEAGDGNALAELRAELGIAQDFEMDDYKDVRAKYVAVDRERDRQMAEKDSMEEAIARHFAAPLCRTCETCTGYKPDNVIVWRCSCGHHRGEHDPTKNVKITAAKLLDDYLAARDLRWLEKRGPPHVLHRSATIIQRAFRGRRWREIIWKTYFTRVVMQLYHRQTERWFYYHKVLGVSTWTPPLILQRFKHRTLPTNKANARRVKERERREAEHTVIWEAVHKDLLSVDSRLEEIKEEFLKQAHMREFYAAVDEMARRKKAWKKVTPESYAHQIAQIIFDEFDLDGSGRWEEPDAVRLFHKFDLQPLPQRHHVSEMIKLLSDVRRYVFMLSSTALGKYTAFNEFHGVLPKSEAVLRLLDTFPLGTEWRVPDMINSQTVAAWMMPRKKLPFKFRARLQLAKAQLQLQLQLETMRFRRATRRRALFQHLFGASMTPEKEEIHTGAVESAARLATFVKALVTIKALAKKPTEVAAAAAAAATAAAGAVTSSGGAPPGTSGTPATPGQADGAADAGFVATESKIGGADVLNLAPTTAPSADEAKPAIGFEVHGASGEEKKKEQDKKGRRRSSAMSGVSSVSSVDMRQTHEIIDLSKINKPALIMATPGMKEERLVLMFEALAGAPIADVDRCRIPGSWLGHLLTAVEIPLMNHEMRKLLKHLVENDDAATQSQLKQMRGAAGIRGAVLSMAAANALDPESQAEEDAVHASARGMSDAGYGDDDAANGGVGGSRRHRPNSARSRPPSAAGNRPPSAAGSRPPSAAGSRPGTTGDSRGGTPASSRPGTAASARPGTAAKSVQMAEVEKAPGDAGRPDSAQPTARTATSHRFRDAVRRVIRTATPGSTPPPRPLTAAELLVKCVGAEIPPVILPKTDGPYTSMDDELKREDVLDPDQCSFGFAVFYLWYTQSEDATRYRWREPLEIVRNHVLSSKYKKEVTTLIPGGLAYTRTQMVKERIAAVASSVRTKYRKKNPPVCQCPSCYRGFGLRRDRRAHVRGLDLCYGQDYMLVAEPYMFLDRHPGDPDDYAGSFYSDDSVNSASDDEEVVI